MKKLGAGLGILIVIIVSVIYFNSAQKEQVEALNKLQQKVTLQLTQMQENGFKITEREMQKDKEHFFMTIVEPHKASVFMTQRGLRLTPEEAEELKDLKFSVDLLYLSDIYSLDIYPAALSPYLQHALTQEKDTNILTQVEEMIQKKVFFMHIDIDHSATDFKGYIKDIDETLEGEKVVKMQLKGLHFSGNIKEEKIVKFQHTLKYSHLFMSDDINVSISGLQSGYELMGPTVYDYVSEYSIEKITSSETPENMLLADKLSVHSRSKVKDGLAVETLKANADNVDIIFEAQKTAMKQVSLDMNISNIDVSTLDRLQVIDKNKGKETDRLIETLVAKNMHLDVSNFSADRVILRGEEMGGFTLNANLDIDPSLDIYRLGIHPKHALNKMSGDIDLSLSKEILTMLKEEPEFMIMYMMYRPKRQLGQRIYHINIGNGDIMINGKPVDF